MDDLRSDNEVRAKDGEEPAATLFGLDQETPEPLPKKRKSSFRRLLAIIMWPIAIAGVVLVLGYYAIEGGYLDKPLKAVAYRVLNDAAGPDYSVDIGRTVLRFGLKGRLVLEAQDVKLSKAEDDLDLIDADKTRISLDISQALTGHVAVEDIAVSGLHANFSALQGAGGEALPLRVDSLPLLMEGVFSTLTKVAEATGKTGTETLRLSGFEIIMPAMQRRTAIIGVNEVVLSRDGAGALSLTGSVAVEGKQAIIAAAASGEGASIDKMSLSVSNFNVSPFVSKWTRDGDPFFGLHGFADLKLEMARTGDDGQPVLKAVVSLPNASFYGDGEPAPVKNGRLEAHYDFTVGKIELDKSLLEFAGARIPFSGGLIDADRLGNDEIKSIGVELVIENAAARPKGSSEGPLPFSAKFLGDLDPHALKLSSQNIYISTRRGLLGGSVTVDFGAPVDPKFDGDSPEISLGLYSKELGTKAIKQLWPFWIAPPARDWAMKNLFGGTVYNGSLALYLPRGRLPLYPERVLLDEKELKISFDMERARVNLAGDIPPLRDTKGHLELAGQKLDVDVESGTAYFPSGRSVDLNGGTFVINDLGDPRHLAETETKIAGPADAVAELATYRPIVALERTGFVPENFSGYVNAELSATFPLVPQGESGNKDTNWDAKLALNDVAVSKPIDGKIITGINGELQIDPRSAKLESVMSVDGVPMEISMVEPLVAGTGIERRRTVSGSLNRQALEKLAPGLGDVIDGSLRMKVDLKDGTKQAVTADLTAATVSIPWAGWTKGGGVSAKLSFEATKTGDGYQLSDFVFSGSDFGVSGSVAIDKKGLSSANFTKVKLAPGDNFSLSLKRGSGGYSISVSGKSADLRGVLGKVKSDGGGGDQSKVPDVHVAAKLETALGFNNEVLRNLDGVYATAGGRPVAVKLSAVTGGGEAVVVNQSNKDGSSDMIDLTTSDAGALARFTGIYSFMYGGLLNLNIRYVEQGQWVGSVDVRDFELINEQRLEQLATTPADNNGKSLNDAVKKRIDLKTQKFSRGNAQLSLQNGVFSISRAVVRGEQVGATFQGVVKDRDGYMNLTGTFMPAYGLNRLFAELPIIGILLGNGRDRGLIGITFKLTGPFQQPKLQINPLSIIAPGVFRSIFEFQ